MKNSKFKSLIIFILAFVMGASSLFAGQFFSFLPVPESESNIRVNKNDKQDIEAVRKLIKDRYYKDVDEEVLEQGVCRGMVNALEDPYSTYMDKTEYENWKASTFGAFEGVGISFQKNSDNEYIIVTVHKGTPADKAGIKEGDLILAVDGKYYDDMDIMAQKIRGEKGSYVNLTLSRKSKQYKKKIKRDSIVIQTVEAESIEENIAMIKINSFEEHTTEEFSNAIDIIKKNGNKSFVLDLRNNGGGLVVSAIEIADILLPKGNITTIKDKNGKVESFTSDADHVDMPFVVLVNGSTASASEILAAAVQDNEAGKIIGVKTFGKGVIQETRSLPSGGALKLTTSEYLSPNGHHIHEKGIKPDIKVTDFNGQENKAIKLLKSK